MKKIKIETIFDLMRNKDPKGFELLNEYHYRTIFGIAFSVLKNEDKSKDVVQNVFMKLYELPYSRFPKSKELTWLYSVTKNEALGMIRKEKRNEGVDELKIEMPHIDFEIEEFVHMDSYYSMIRSLNEKQREVVTMKVLGDLSHKEIAQMLGKPIGTIQWIYNTSIKKLRAVLGGLTAFVIFSGAGFINRYKAYIDQSNASIPEIDGPIEVVPKDEAAVYWLIAAAGLFLASAIIWIVFFKNSDKILKK